MNLAKCSIIFGMRVDQQRRTQIQHILNINIVGDGGKYLGLPEQFDKGKVQDF